uniref:Thrombomodulin n=1 Tax=Sparus aurata TaxID=8175 RepID=A0A671XIK6_SPAAU
MTAVRNALLVCGVLLCALEETVLSQYGRCVGNHCFALFQKLQDFPGARASCKSSGGQLFTYSQPDLEELLRALPRGLSGRFWLELRSAGRTTEEASARLQNCSSVSVTEGENTEVLSGLCSESLSGYLCQYSVVEPCGHFQAGGGAQYPDSKHLCFSGIWLPAPWVCEVMNGGCERNCTSTERNTIHTCRYCPERECPAICDRNTDNENADMQQCECPDGYILDMVNDTAVCSDIDECQHEQCDQKCENSFGGYRCLCNEGYELRKGYKCVLTDDSEDYDGSGQAVNPTEPSTSPASVPYYIKAGSAMGIFMFGLLCGGMLILLVMNMFKRSVQQEEMGTA